MLHSFRAILYKTGIYTLFIMCFCTIQNHAFAANSAIEPTVEIQIVHKAPAQKPIIALSITPPQGQYIYAYDDTYALPLRITSPNGLQIQYPQSQERADLLDPKQIVRVYDTITTVFITAPDSMTGQSKNSLLEEKKNTIVELTLSFLMCSPTACTPFKKLYKLEIPKNTPSLEKTALAKAYAKAIHTASVPPASAASSVSQTQTSAPTKTWDIPPDSIETHNTLWQFTPQEANALFMPTSLWPALLLGLFAGLILNVMPCVLPVITIKLTTLLNAASTLDPQAAQSSFRMHNIFFASGIISYFLILAVFMALSGLAWGSLFQLVPVVFGLLIMVFSFALSMFGVFTLPAPQVQASSSKNADFQSFTTGFFVTLLATPCSGPLLGGVLGWAATQSLPTLVLVFFAMGLGMASPYIVLSIFPATVRFLPKPGAWTRIFEYIVGFLLLMTSLYLLSILPDNLLIPSLFALIVIALALWIWGQWGYLAPMRQQSIAGICSLVLILGAVSFVFMPASTKYVTQSFSETDFASTLGKGPIMLIFTADWCPSCKVLEQSVLTPDALQTWEKDYDLTILEVDITDHNPDDMALLRALHSISIPLVAIFPTGEKAYEPYILRDFFTQSSIEQVLQSLGNTE